MEEKINFYAKKWILESKNSKECLERCFIVDALKEAEKNNLDRAIDRLKSVVFPPPLFGYMEKDKPDFAEEIIKEYDRNKNFI